MGAFSELDTKKPATSRSPGLCSVVVFLFCIHLNLKSILILYYFLFSVKGVILRVRHPPPSATEILRFVAISVELPECLIGLPPLHTESDSACREWFVFRACTRGIEPIKEHFHNLLPLVRYGAFWFRCLDRFETVLE
jgi:hypothetical protein